MRHFLTNLAVSLFLGLVVIVVISAVTAPATAQTRTTAAVVPPDYEEWSRVATRAEDAISTMGASNEAFDILRAEVVGWRERFLRAQSNNATRIETLQSQIAALGPAPAEGETEATDLAARRVELNAQLTRLTAPVRTAEEAFSRADGIVREIDVIVRERQAELLLRLGPSPLNPTLWPEAATKTLNSLRAIHGETVTAWGADATRQLLRDRFPVTLMYLLIAVLLLVRGRAVMVKMTGLVLERSVFRGRGLAEFLTSLGQIILPVLGIFLLVQALLSTGMIGLRGQSIVRALPFLVICTYGARWLAALLFPVQDEVVRPLPATPDQGRSMRRTITLLGSMVGLVGIVIELARYENYSEGVRAVLYFPFILFAGLALVRIGWTLLRIARVGEGEGETPVFGARALGLAGRASLVVGLLGPVICAVGYMNAGLFLVIPATFSLALLGMLYVLYFVIGEIYSVITRTDPHEAREALIPILAMFALVLLSTPLFALIWSARVADLTEIWSKFRAGFSIGDTKISPANFLTFVIVFSALYMVTRLIQGVLRSNVLPKTRIDPGGQTAILSGAGYVGIFLATVVAITTAGIDLSSLAIVAGALSIGIGFGLQNIVSNFVSGIILLIERPISQGDWIKVGGNMGIVKEISVRSTRIETFDRTDVIVPNADFVSNPVTNWTRANVMGRVIVTVGVAYGTDTRKVERILKEIAMEHPLVTANPEPGVDFTGFGADSLDFQIKAVLSDINFGISVKTEMYHRIAERFAEEGIEIPFAQRDVWLRNSEALRGEEKPEPVREPETPSALSRAHETKEDMGVDNGSEPDGDAR